MKNIAVFIDGTWNKPDAIPNKPSGFPDEGISKETNVCLLHRSCAENERCIYYDNGVGTEWYDKIIGGVTGAGLSENIKQAYQFVSYIYEKGDAVFLFGFSRGAFTARSLSGFLFACGLPGKATDNKVTDLFETYKRGDEDGKKTIKRENGACPVKMIGVWDTVGELGIPHILFDEKITDRYYLFHDTRLNPEVEAGYHALALDEARHCFKPTLWDGTANTVQVCFAGVHGDVGGGYPDRHHSDVALKWIMRAAARHGLKLSNEHQFRIDLRKNIHDSYHTCYGLRCARKLNKAKLHRSVVEKVHLGVGYWPLALTDAESKTFFDRCEILKAYEIAE